jgi:hypothetical protein
MDKNTIIKEKFQLNPGYSSYHFFIHDDVDELYKVISEANYHDALVSDRFYQSGNIIVIGTESDFLGIEITFEVLLQEPKIDTNENWVKTLNTKIELNKGVLNFFDPPDGDFYSLKIPSGKYFMNIFYGLKEKSNNMSDDYYLIQLWPEN